MKVIFLIFLMLIHFSILAQTQLTIGEVFDFDIGDEFHYEMPYAPSNADRVIITNKTYSQNLDTLCYERLHSEYMISSSPPMSYNFSSYTDNMCLTNLDSLIVEMYFNMPDSNYLLYDTIVEFDTLLCNSEINGYDYATMGIEPVIYKSIWGKGIGLLETHISQPGDPSVGISETRLFYYKKGTESCGTPDYTSIDVVTKEDLKLYPNPVKDNLYIELNSAKFDELSIYNALGELLYNLEERNSKTVINTEILPVGVYLLVVKSNNHVYTQKVYKIE